MALAPQYNYMQKNEAELQLLPHVNLSDSYKKPKYLSSNYKPLQ